MAKTVVSDHGSIRPDPMRGRCGGAELRHLAYELITEREAARTNLTKKIGPRVAK